jgi:multisubunit Na+/H+ antiporter MnhB subunit
MKKNSGFIQIIVLIIVFVILAYYFGKDPVELWEKIKPVFEFVLNLFVKAIGFLIKLIAKAWEMAR